METATEVQEIRFHTIRLNESEAQAIVADPREFVKALVQLIGAVNGHTPKKQRRARKTAKKTNLAVACGPA